MTINAICVEFEELNLEAKIKQDDLQSRDVSLIRPGADN